jgi:hypothetical protein
MEGRRGVRVGIDCLRECYVLRTSTRRAGRAGRAGRRVDAASKDAGSRSSVAASNTRSYIIA